MKGYFTKSSCLTKWFGVFAMGFVLSNLEASWTTEIIDDTDLAPYPRGVCTDSLGNLFIAAAGNDQIRKVTPSGTITTFISAGLDNPFGVCVDSSDNLYVSNFSTGIIGKYDSTGAIINASFISGLSNPYGMFIDGSGNLYVANWSTGKIGQYSSSSGAPINASLISGLNGVTGVSLDNLGNIYAAVSNAGIIGKYDSAGGVIDASFISGLSNPNGLCIDNSGNIYVADTFNDRILMHSASGVTTIASGLNHPYNVFFDNVNGVLFVSDSGNQRVLKLTPPAVLEVDFTNGAAMSGPVTGGLKFAGTGDCIFSGSTTAGIEINAGNVKVASATPLGTSGVNMTGGSLEATAAMTFPALTMTNAATVQADADGVHVATASGSGTLTLAGLAGTEAIYLDEIASTGGVSSAANPVHLTTLTNLHTNSGTFNELDLDSLPGGNVYGSGAVTASKVVVGVDIPAGVFGSLTTHLINLGTHSISQAVIAN